MIRFSLICTALVVLPAFMHQLAGLKPFALRLEKELAFGLGEHTFTRRLLNNPFEHNCILEGVPCRFWKIVTAFPQRQQLACLGYCPPEKTSAKSGRQRGGQMTIEAL